MTTVPTISLNLCDYNKDKKKLSFASEYFGMPNEFFIQSHVTGRVVKFVPVQYGHRLFDEDGWDGEQRVYIPATPEMDCRVDHCVIYNQW